MNLVKKIERGFNMKIVEVVAAVIKNNDKYLGTQRGYGEFKGMWEFPGGKIEENEAKEDALKREIKEEMNADINVDKYICTVNYDYPNFHLIMHTYLCSLKEDNIELLYHDDNELEHESIKWLTMDNIKSVDWLPADIEVVNKLKKEMN